MANEPQEMYNFSYQPHPDIQDFLNSQEYAKCHISPRLTNTSLGIIVDWKATQY